MGKDFRHSYHYVKEIFEAANCQLLSKQYIDTHTKLDYVCSCGNQSKIRFSDFQSGERCLKCAGHDSPTYEEVKSEFAENGCTLLAKEYKKNSIRMAYICSCGNRSEVSWTQFKNGTRCRSCGVKKQSDKRRFSYEYVKKEFEKQGCILLSKEYIDSQTKLDYVCTCGSESQISFSNFRSGKRCRKCASDRTAKLQRLDYAEVSQAFADAECELLSLGYKNAHQKLDYICSCGNIAQITYANFRKGNRCEQCSREKRSGSSHYKWNPNLTDEERIINRDYREYIKWRTAVYVRDNYVCQICNKKGKLNAHHIESYRDNPSLRTEINNGITMCEDCHISFHVKYGYGNNTMEQLVEFSLDSTELRQLVKAIK